MATYGTQPGQRTIALPEGAGYVMLTESSPGEYFWPLPNGRRASVHKWPNDQGYVGRIHDVMTFSLLKQTATIETFEACVAALVEEAAK